MVLFLSLVMIGSLLINFMCNASDLPFEFWRERRFMSGGLIFTACACGFMIACILIGRAV